MRFYDLYLTDSNDMAYTTKRSLLSKIDKGNEVGWHEFYKTYAPLIWVRGGDRGLKAEEKETLIQDVCISVFNGGQFNYAPEKGRFRDFLKTIIDRRAYDLLRKRYNANAREVVTEKIGELLDDASPSELEDIWDKEWRDHVMNQSLIELKAEIAPNTFQAFELYALKGWSAAKVAKFTGMSENSVYVSKNRALSKLKAIVNQLKDK